MKVPTENSKTIPVSAKDEAEAAAARSAGRRQGGRLRRGADRAARGHAPLVRGGSSPATWMSWRTTRSPTPSCTATRSGLGRVEFDAPGRRVARSDGPLVLHVPDHWPVHEQPRNPDPGGHFPHRRVHLDEPGWPARRAPGIDFLHADIFTDTDDGDVDPFAWRPWPAIEERGARPHL